MGRQSLVHPLPIADIAEHIGSYTWALQGLCQRSVEGQRGGLDLVNNVVDLHI